MNNQEQNNTVILNIRPLQCKISGVILSTDSHNASLYIEDQKISIYGRIGGVSYQKAFSVGDYAEYDSEPLPYYSYYGYITRISKTGITIKSINGNGIDRGEEFTIDLHTFASRNCRFNIDDILAKNYISMETYPDVPWQT